MAHVAFLAGAALLLLTSVSPAIGKNKQVLVDGAKAVALNAQSQTVQTQSPSTTHPPPRTSDPDQGDDHASDNAIFKVCNKDTPAARRSAICNGGVSPN